MKGLVTIAIMLASLAAHAESQERKPATRIDLGSALSNALNENDKLREQLEDRAAERSSDEEKSKIYVELGDGR